VRPRLCVRLTCVCLLHVHVYVCCVCGSRAMWSKRTKEVGEPVVCLEDTDDSVLAVLATGVDLRAIPTKKKGPQPTANPG